MVLQHDIEVEYLFGVDSSTYVEKEKTFVIMKTMQNKGQTTCSNRERAYERQFPLRASKNCVAAMELCIFSVRGFGHAPVYT